MIIRKPFEHVMLVDDDTTTNHVNKRLLIKGEFATHVDVAINGQEALDKLRTFSDTHNERLDLVLLDLKMEGMDGFHFLDTYCQLPEEQQARLMILLTSPASFYDLTRLQNYACVAEHLYKPLSKAHLNDFVHRFL